MTRAPARPHRALALHSLVLAGLLGFAGARLLPVRVASVDAVIAAVVIARLASCVGLVSGSVLGLRIARVVAFATLLVGFAVTAALLVSVAAVAGIYDAVGKGTAVAFGIVLALVVPYLVVFPSFELHALRPAADAR